MKAAEDVLQSGYPNVQNNTVGESAIAGACEELQQRGNANHKLYKDLVGKVVKLLDSGNL